MPQNRMVLTLLDQASAYGRGILEGICSFGLAETDWTVYPLATTRELTRAQIEAFNPIGIISRGRENESWRDMARQRGIPVVLVAHTLTPLTDYAVLPDYHAVGVMGAKHLIEQGFANLGHRGSPFVTNQEVCRGFFDAALEAGCTIDGIDMTEVEVTELGIIEQQEQWLRGARKPLGVMATNDAVAVKLVISAQRCGLQFGRDIAVLGVTNDTVICDGCRPSISSIAMPLQRHGYVAAQMLHQLIEGKKPPQRVVRMAPTRVVVRGSTDLAATDDLELIRAVNFIRANLHRHIGVQDVADHARLSRRTLERRFVRHLRHTVDREIRRQRVEQAKRLLHETEMSQKRIASMCGFTRPEHLSRTFKQFEGVAPMAYRKQNAVPL